MPKTRAHTSNNQHELNKQRDEHPHLAEGGREVLLIIFDLIQNTSPNTLKALALVSREFYHLAAYVRHRNLVLDLAPPRLEASYDRLQYAVSQQLLPAIQRLDIKDQGGAPYRSVLPDGSVTSTLGQYQNMVTVIATLIPKMTGLKDLSWYPSPSFAVDIAPDIVFQALRSCPKVRLRTKLGRGRFDKPHKEKMDKYQANANLYELDADFTFRDGKQCIAFTQPLKQVLLSSRGIRSLRLDIRQPRGGCVIPCQPREYCGFGFVGDESLPPLEELALINYPWGTYSTASGAHLPPNSVGYPGQGQEMDHWADKFDWSRIQRLTTTYVNFALKIMPKLVSLREVDFRTHHFKSEVVRFYQECPTALDSIGAYRLECVTLEGILRHGSALKKLRLHTVEGSKWSETAMDIVSLRAIRDRCPLIEELVLDIPRADDWPWEFLDVLASFPRLRNLTIYFELGINHEGEPVKPYVTFEAVDTLYKYILSRSPPGQMCKITRFHVYSGAPPALGFGYPAPSAIWPDRNSTHFVCTLSERDDEAAEGVFEIVCPKILCSNPSVSERNMRLAHDGPMSRSLPKDRR